MARRDRNTLGRDIGWMPGRIPPGCSKTVCAGCGRPVICAHLGDLRPTRERIDEGGTRLILEPISIRAYWPNRHGQWKRSERVWISHQHHCPAVHGPSADRSDEDEKKALAEAKARGELEVPEDPESVPVQVDRGPEPVE